MIQHGPIDVLVLAAGEPHFDGKILTELERQAATGVIRVVDAMILIKDGDGARRALNIEELPQKDREALGFIETGTRGLFDSEDAETLYEGMVPGSGVVALAIEHVWAVALVNAIADSGVQVALNFRVPVPIVEEAFASLAAQ